MTERLTVYFSLFFLLFFFLLFFLSSFLFFLLFFFSCEYSNPSSGSLLLPTILDFILRAPVEKEATQEQTGRGEKGMIGPSVNGKFLFLFFSFLFMGMGGVGGGGENWKVDGQDEDLKKTPKKKPKWNEREEKIIGGGSERERV